jgi:predicted metal-binding membrane protein
MRYGFSVTDFVHGFGWNSLRPREARLALLVARPKRIALGSIVVLTAAGWFALGLLTANTPLGIEALCRPSPATGWQGLLLALPIWAAMVLAMMLPTAGPMVLTYAEIADTAAQKGERVVSPLVLTAGYAVVWLGFAAAAALLQWAAASVDLLDGGATGRLIGGAVVIGAGLYQFSPMKRACLALCQRPFPFFFSNWTTEPAEVLRLGLRQGVICLGCCWAMMLVMFAVGAMNVVWMAALGVVMTIEKLTMTPRFSEAVGFVFVAAGFGLLVVSVS